MTKKPRTTKSNILLALLMFFPLVLASTVFAQPRREVMRQAPEGRPETTSSTKPEAESTESTNASESDDADSRGQRIKARKDRLKVKLSKAESAKLKRLCAPTQAKLQRYRQRVIGVSVSQQNRKDNLTERLIRLSDKLMLADVDTAELNQKISGLQNEYDKLITSLEEFGAAVDDGAEINCSDDPEGYKAALLEAREYRSKVVANAKSVKAYINDELKPVLQTVRQSLANSETEEN